MISSWRMVEATNTDGTPTLIPSRDEYREPFDVEKDGSGLLRMMQRRLEETGWSDEEGKALFAELAAKEMAIQPVEQDAQQWLLDNGFPEPDEWDDYDQREYKEMRL